ALKLKREGLCFHSFRHNVSNSLDVAGVPQSDTARVLGHAVAGMSYGTYSQAGPGLKRVAATVEQITYEGPRPQHGTHSERRHASDHPIARRVPPPLRGTCRRPPAACAVARIRLSGRFFVFADVRHVHAESGDQGAGRTEAGSRAVPALCCDED